MSVYRSKGEREGKIWKQELKRANKGSMSKDKMRPCEVGGPWRGLQKVNVKPQDLTLLVYFRCRAFRDPKSGLCKLTLRFAEGVMAASEAFHFARSEQYELYSYRADKRCEKAGK